MEREKAVLGLFITLEPPSQPMLTEAASLGFYTTPLGNRPIQRLQIRTVAELLDGKAFDMPYSAGMSGVKQAPKIQTDPGQTTLDVD